MIKYMEIGFKRAAGISATLAEGALWVFVTLGVAKMIENGADTLASKIAAVMTALVLIASAFYLLAFCCKLVASLTNKKQ